MLGPMNAVHMAVKVSPVKPGTSPLLRVRQESEFPLNLNVRSSRPASQRASKQSSLDASILEALTLRQSIGLTLPVGCLVKSWNSIKEESVEFGCVVLGLTILGARE